MDDSPVNHDYGHGDSPVTGARLCVIYFPCLKMTPLSHWCLGTKLMTPQSLMPRHSWLPSHAVMPRHSWLPSHWWWLYGWFIIWHKGLRCVTLWPEVHIKWFGRCHLYVVYYIYSTQLHSWQSDSLYIYCEKSIVLCHYCGALVLLFHSYVAVKKSSFHLLQIMLNNLSHCTLNEQ